MCFSESSLNYNVIHKSKYDKTTKGICGIKPELWNNILNDIEPNSLHAGSLILTYLLKKYNNNFKKALKHYKGAKKNLKGVNIALKTYNKIKDNK